MFLSGLIERHEIAKKAYLENKYAPTRAIIVKAMMDAGLSKFHAVRYANRFDRENNILIRPKK